MILCIKGLHLLSEGRKESRKETRKVKEKEEKKKGKKGGREGEKMSHCIRQIKNNFNQILDYSILSCHHYAKLPTLCITCALCKYKHVFLANFIAVTWVYLFFFLFCKSLYIYLYIYIYTHTHIQGLSGKNPDM